jgi:hypothetical protein
MMDFKLDNLINVVGGILVGVLTAFFARQNSKDTMITSRDTALTAREAAFLKLTIEQNAQLEARCETLSAENTALKIKDAARDNKIAALELQIADLEHELEEAQRP